MRSGPIIFIMMLMLEMSAGSDCSAQNIGINSTGNAPNASAMLDIDASNKGLLVPRVALQSSTDAATIASPATSLLVYSMGGVLSDGYYYNSGTPGSPVWSKFSTGTLSSGGGCATEISAEHVSVVHLKDCATYCAGLTENGSSDWRLGSADEILRLGLPVTSDASYLWTTTPSYVTNTEYAAVRLSDGAWTYVLATSTVSTRCRCVR